MAYEKQTWISYDDNKTEEQNIKDGAVVTAERMNHIEDGVEAQVTKIEFDSHLDDKGNPHEVTAHQVGALTAEETSANVIDQVIGKEKGQISVITDFKNKVTNSNVENPHWAGAAFVGDKLEKPSYFVTEVAQTRYNSLSEKDGNTAFVTATGADLRPSLCLKYDLLEIVKRRLGEDFFIDREAVTTEQQLSLLDAIVTNFEIATYAKGTGVEAGKATNWCASKLWFDNSRWTTGTPQNTTGEIKRLAFALDPVNKLSRYLDEKGILQVIVYGGLSDGVTNTNVYADYSDLLIDIEVSSNKHIKSIVAAYSGENIDKKFVGLENVDNYETATQVDAESGTATDKFMTPLRTKQHVSSRIASQTEAESGTATEKLMTPLRIKQHVDKRIATQAEVIDGEASDKLISPKGLADTVKFSEVFSPGSSLSNVASEGTLVPHGITAGGSLNYIKNRPYTVNSNGTFTFNRAANLLVTGGMKLVVGDTNPTDYLYVNAYVNNDSNDFIALGATAATNGTLRLTWSAMGQRVISVNSGDILSFKIGLRSGKQAFAVQFTSLKIEEI